MDYGMYLDALKEFVLGPTMIESVCNGLRKWTNDFSQIEEAYQEAREKIRDCAGERTSEQLADSISKQAGILLFFSAVQGLRMNRDHFNNPALPDCTWSTVDYNAFLRPELAQRLPGYSAEERIQNELLAAISVDESVAEAVIDYQSALETAGAKLAHYYGYRFGNEIFPYCLPGYYEDAALSVAYKRMLESYLG